MANRENTWRYTAQNPMVFGILDARAMLPFVLLAFHLRMWTFELAVASTVLFGVLQLWRITPIEAVKAAWLYCATFGFRYNAIVHRHRRYRHDHD
jgi:hypothetical protein